MNVVFFEKELLKVQKRYNQTFGRQVISDLKTRFRIILSIVSMGVLIKKIKSDRFHGETRDRILLLLKMRDTINQTLDRAEECWGRKEAL